MNFFATFVTVSLLLVIKLCQIRGVATGGGGRVLWCSHLGRKNPRSSKLGSKLFYLNKTMIFFFALGDFEIIETNDRKFNKCDLCEVHNFCWGQALWLLAPGIKIPATSLIKYHATLSDDGHNRAPSTSLVSLNVLEPRP
jgi:hypothetical protein